MFAKIDLMKAYNQILVTPEDILKTAITSLFGLFEFLRLPFGPCKYCTDFQCFTDTVLRGLPFVYAYINDLPVVSMSIEEHEPHLHLLF